MADERSNEPTGEPEEPENPGADDLSGKGSGRDPQGQPSNPLEALFRSLGSGDPGDLNAIMAQLQSTFSTMFPGMNLPAAGTGAGSGFFGRGLAAPGSGVNWELTRDTARKTVAGLGADPTPTGAQQRALSEAVSLAEVWLDQATGMPRISAGVAAWSRAEWVEKTLPVWRRLVEPVATSIADAMEGALAAGGEDASAIPGMAGLEQMLRPMLRTSGATMFGFQLGQGLGKLATEVVGATDIGLPLSEPGQVALLPTNISAFGEGLDQSDTDITLYLALRECARQRLFAHAGWLRELMLTLVEEYARGITIDTSALEEAVGELDPNNLEELGEKLQGGLFEPQKSPAQLAALERLETMLALVEGWVDDVVTQAAGRWMPSAAALAETVRRARATGGPAEETFATLVGLELRPRRMRDAANLWAAVRDDSGPEGRDAVWTHPDLVPGAADLDDPLGFVSRQRHEESSSDDFDAALAKLLEDDEPRPDGEPGDGLPR
jgi:putative hydrolase